MSRLSISARERQPKRQLEKRQVGERRASSRDACGGSKALTSYESTGVEVERQAAPVEAQLELAGVAGEDRAGEAALQHRRDPSQEGGQVGHAHVPGVAPGGVWGRRLSMAAGDRVLGAEQNKNPNRSENSCCFLAP